MRGFKEFIESTNMNLHWLSESIRSHFPESTWYEGDCLAFAKALAKSLQKRGFQSEIVYAGDVHVAVATEGVIIDSRGIMLPAYKNHWMREIKKVNKLNKRDGSLLFPLDFVPANQLPYNPWLSKYGFEHQHPGAERAAQRRLEAIFAEKNFIPRKLKQNYD